MQDIRSIAENIGSIRERRSELAALRPLDRHLAEELSDLEAKVSVFAETCVRYHQVNLCQAGFIYGDVLRHPADPEVGVAVRLGDRVEFVEGLEAPPGEMTIAAATALLGAHVGRGLAFRDWHADDRSIGQREDDLFIRSRRSEALRRSIEKPGNPGSEEQDGATAILEDMPGLPAISSMPAESASTKPPPRIATGRVKTSRTCSDERMPDLFG